MVESIAPHSIVYNVFFVIINDFFAFRAGRSSGGGFGLLCYFVGQWGIFSNGTTQQMGHNECDTCTGP
jgi:hypothetical protein